MQHYRRKYSAPNVAVRMKHGKPKWVMSINEGVVAEATDDRGRTVFQENGTPKTTTKWRTLRKAISDLPATKGSTKGIATARKSLANWQRDLEERAEEDYLTAIQRSEHDAQVQRFSYESMLVPDFLDMYLEERKLDNLEASTIDGYRFAMVHPKAYFEDVAVGEVTTDMLKAFNKSLLDKGLSSTTRNRALKIFKFAWAAHRSGLPTYPWEGFKKWSPKPKESKTNPLNERSLAKVSADLKVAPPTQFMTAVELALRSAMRVGEICGLMWKDVDLDSGDIEVRRAIGRVKGGTNPREYVKAPKYTGSNPDHDSSRNVPGTPNLARLLRRRFAYMVSEYREAYDVDETEASEAVSAMYVIGFVDGRHASPTVIGRTWRGYSQGLMGEARRRPTFHDLRGTKPTDLGRHEKNPAVVAAIAGHADPTITYKKYIRGLDKDKAQAMALSDDLI